MDGAGLDLFAGLGWSWDYDTGVRLSGAWPGRGDLPAASPSAVDGFRFELRQRRRAGQQMIDEAAGTVAETVTGAYGRIESRGGVPFGYDPAGRRTEDDRFVYDWSWRSELMQVTVKESLGERREPIPSPANKCATPTTGWAACIRGPTTACCPPA